MQNLLTSKQTREADAHTISNKPISSIDLMEAALIAFVREFEKEVTDKYIPISIYCGTGNNGGDGLAVARLLYASGYKNVSVKISKLSNKSTQDFGVNRERLKLTWEGLNVLFIKTDWNRLKLVQCSCRFREKEINSGALERNNQ